jgi:predicted ATPase with chaperone activity
MLLRCCFDVASVLLWCCFARSMHRILRVARTIADLADSGDIRTAHLTEAIGYRKGEGTGLRAARRRMPRSAAGFRRYDRA